MEWEIMRIGYIRVSSTDQNESRQIEEMKSFSVEKWFIEKQSGATIKERPVFQDVLQFVRPGDTLLVEAIDRLGRNYDEIIETIQWLKKRDVQLMITSLPIMTEAIDHPLLDRFIKDLILQVLAMMAEQERMESKRRQEQGIALAKAKGHYRGRPVDYSPVSKNRQKQIIYTRIVEMLKAEWGISAIARETGVSRLTIYRIKKELEMKGEE